MTSTREREKTQSRNFIRAIGLALCCSCAAGLTPPAEQAGERAVAQTAPAPAAASSGEEALAQPVAGATVDVSAPICLPTTVAPAPHATEPPSLAPPERHPVDHAERLLLGLTPYVEAACEAYFKGPPRVVVVDAATAADVFRRDLADDFAARYAHLTRGQRRALMSRAARTAAASCVARYSVTERAVILVRASFDDQRVRMGLTSDDAWGWLRATLAHELVHALDDEQFGLGPRFAAAAADPEAARAFAMTVEGRAVVFGRDAADSAGVDARLSRILPGGDKPQGNAALTLHLTYGLGAEFIEALVARGGVELANRALTEAPLETHIVCHPDRWPGGGLDGDPDGDLNSRPAAILDRAALGAPVTPLSELQLRVRYAMSDGMSEAVSLFAGFRGGRQVLATDTNHAVLAFATEGDAARYEERSREEAAVTRRGTLVLRAVGGDADAALERLVRAVDT